MSREQLYRETTDILFQAYFNDTLRHGACHACAVGNIVAARNGYTVSVTEDVTLWLKDGKPVYDLYWPTYCVTNDEIQEINEHALKHEAVVNQIASTGYTPQEIAMIEYAFEMARSYKFGAEENMFRGLEAVLEVLSRIHQIENNQPEVSRFREHYQTLVHH